MRHRASLIHLTLLTVLWATEAPADQIWRFRGFTTRDGLSHDIVRDVLEDRAGALWFATMGGVTRYDPRTCSYETFTYGGSLPRQEAMSLALGRDGKIWVATQGAGSPPTTAPRPAGPGTRPRTGCPRMRSPRCWWTDPAESGPPPPPGASPSSTVIGGAPSPRPTGSPAGEMGRCTELTSGGDRLRDLRSPAAPALRRSALVTDPG